MTTIYIVLPRYHPFPHMKRDSLEQPKLRLIMDSCNNQFTANYRMYDVNGSVIHTSIVGFNPYDVKIVGVLDKDRAAIQLHQQHTYQLRQPTDAEIRGKLKCSSSKVQLTSNQLINIITDILNKLRPIDLDTSLVKSLQSAINV